jgi:2',3'-cyclic-nucleotide 2'-phosphodiesterase (5'-nucleotidase family)
MFHRRKCHNDLARLDWIVTDPLDSIKEEIELQRGKFDVLIVLSHCGI